MPPHLHTMVAKAVEVAVDDDWELSERRTGGQMMTVLRKKGHRDIRVPKNASDPASWRRFVKELLNVGVAVPGAKTPPKSERGQSTPAPSTVVPGSETHRPSTRLAVKRTGAGARR